MKSLEEVLGEAPCLLDDDYPQTCTEAPWKHPHCAAAALRQWVASEEVRERAAEAMELVMRRHLPVKFEDGEVMCPCHGPEEGAEIHVRQFVGPVFQRQHVAAEVLADPGFLNALGLENQ